MSIDRKNTHGPAGKALWPLLSTGLSALAAEYSQSHDSTPVFGVCSCPNGVSDLAIASVFYKKGPGALL